MHVSNLGFQQTSLHRRLSHDRINDPLLLDSHILDTLIYPQFIRLGMEGAESLYLVCHYPYAQ